MPETAGCPRCHSQAVCQVGATTSASSLLELQCIICSHIYYEWDGEEPRRLRRLRTYMKKKGFDEVEILENEKRIIGEEINKVEANIQQYGLQVWPSWIPVVRVVPPDGNRSSSSGKKKNPIKCKVDIFGADYET